MQETSEREKNERAEQLTKGFTPVVVRTVCFVLTIVMLKGCNYGFGVYWEKLGLGCSSIRVPNKRLMVIETSKGTRTRMTPKVEV